MSRKPSHDFVFGNRTFTLQSADWGLTSPPNWPMGLKHLAAEPAVAYSCSFLRIDYRRLIDSKKIAFIRQFLFIDIEHMIQHILIFTYQTGHIYHIISRIMY